MKFIGNVINEIRDINGFQKEELFEIKKLISKIKSKGADPEELEELLKKKFPLELIDFYSAYLIEIQKFCDDYIKNKGKKYDFTAFISEILKEIKHVSRNLLNLSLNSRNIRRFLKNNEYLEELLKNAQILQDKSEILISELEPCLMEDDEVFNNDAFLWVEINKIMDKNLIFKNKISELDKWEEISELIEFIESTDIKKSKQSKKKKKKKKIESITFHFYILHEYFSEMPIEQVNYYLNLIYILFNNNFLEESKEEFVNILERKEIAQNLKEFIIPVIRTLIIDKLDEILGKIEEYSNEYKIKLDQKIHKNKLLEEKISVIMPKIVDYYFNCLEKKYQALINEETEKKSFKALIDAFSEESDALYSILNDLEVKINKFETTLYPYEEITIPLKKILDSVSSEIVRRKEDNLIYLKSIKNERLRDEIRNYLATKILEVNELINSYQDETSEIVRKEFPQLKKIKDMLKDYKLKISAIKGDVFSEIKSVKEKNVEFYHLIKQWEENFNQKKQQLSFSLSLLLNKIFKSFKELIEEEKMVLEPISEITDKGVSSSDLPLNFAISEILADNMTEDELRDRIKELNSKINKLSLDLELHQKELGKLEDIISTKVKIREGMLMSDIVCNVCHENINLAKGKIIKCPFCSSTYHYLCVAYWISKYNACPTCQNNFLDPNSEMFST